MSYTTEHNYIVIQTKSPLKPRKAQAILDVLRMFGFVRTVVVTTNDDQEDQAEKIVRDGDELK